jgi:hypothetical protein
LSALPDNAIAALKLALKGTTLVDAESAFEAERSIPHGGVAAAHVMAEKLGLRPLLGPRRKTAISPTLVPDGRPVEAVVDDTLLKRRGKKAWAASWFHDGSRRTLAGQCTEPLALLISLMWRSSGGHLEPGR